MCVAMQIDLKAIDKDLKKMFCSSKEADNNFRFNKAIDKDFKKSVVYQKLIIISDLKAIDKDLQKRCCSLKEADNNFVILNTKTTSQ